MSETIGWVWGDCICMRFIVGWEIRDTGDWKVCLAKLFFCYDLMMLYLCRSVDLYTYGYEWL